METKHIIALIVFMAIGSTGLLLALLSQRIRDATLFFLVLGLRRDDLTRFTGWAVTLLSLPTCALPAFLALTGNYRLISVRTMGPLWPKQQYRNRYFDSPPGASFGMERMAALYGRYYDSLGRTPWTGKYVIISP